MEDKKTWLEGYMRELYQGVGVCCKNGSGVFGLNPVEVDPEDKEGEEAKARVLRKFPDHFESFTRCVTYSLEAKMTYLSSDCRYTVRFFIRPTFALCTWHAMQFPHDRFHVRFLAQLEDGEVCAFELPL